MIKNRDDFFDRLWEDYLQFDKKDRRKCFVYGYLKQKKDSRAEILARSREAVIEYSIQKKPDKYTLLRSAYLAMERSCVMNEGDYLAILTGLIGKDIPKKYQTLSGRENIRRAEEMLEQRFLIGCVSDFFYNLGYRVNEGDGHSKSIKVTSKRLKEDGYNDEFEMMYSFSVYSNEDILANNKDIGSFAAFGSIDDEYIEKCTQLYDVLLKEKNCMAFVPLYIDRETGAGIYIIGRDKFDENTLGFKKSDKTEACLVCIVYFYGIEAITRVKNSTNDEVSMIMFVKNAFRSVRKAFDSFTASVSEKDFYENYPDENDERLPNGADKHFELYFISKKKAEDMRKKALLQTLDEKERLTLMKIQEEERLRSRAVESEKMRTR